MQGTAVLAVTLLIRGLMNEDSQHHQIEEMEESTTNNSLALVIAYATASPSSKA